MNAKGHQMVSEILLGYSMPDVDRWIDNTQALMEFGPKHRLYHHNVAALHFIKENFGLDASRAALLHILIDAAILDVDDVIVSYSKFYGVRK